MREKIEILKINQKLVNDILEVVISIKINQKEYELIYIIEGGIKEVPLLSDAMVVTFLPYAIKHGLDIYSVYPISTQLYYNLKKHVIPQLSIFNGTKEDKVSIVMPFSDEKYNGDWVGTGISLGIDSFATIHEYSEESLPKDYRLTCLVHLKTGAHHGLLGFFDKEYESKLFEIEHQKVKRYCESNNRHLITIQTNLFEITNAEFGYNFDTTHTFRNLACILLLQNYFSKYYYASSYNLDNFSVSLNDDASHYEKWLLAYISNNNVSFYSANEDMDRIEKTKYISQFKDTYDSLHVCWKNDKNCGVCAKCIRTLVTLDILGELENYKGVFNLDEYKKDREYYICHVISHRKKDPFYYDIYKYMVSNYIKIPSYIKRIFVILTHALSRYGIKGFFVRLKNKIRSFVCE